MTAHQPEKNIIMCLSPGRSGTKLLTEILSLCPESCVLHEEEPNFRDYTEITRESLDSARQFVRDVKYPDILARDGKIYIETSHLFGKGFFEIFVEEGIRFNLILLHRDPREVAKSHWRIRAVPARSKKKQQYLLRPDGANVMLLPNWQRMSDYQLCYWYALEVERRKELYRQVCVERGLGVVDLHLSDCLDFDRLNLLLQPLGITLPDSCRNDHAALTARKINRKGRYLPKIPLVPFSWQEKKVWHALGEEGRALRPVILRRYSN